MLAGEHASQWANRLGSPTRQARIGSPERGRTAAAASGGELDMDKLRQELRELKLMALRTSLRHIFCHHRVDFSSLVSFFAFACAYGLTTIGCIRLAGADDRAKQCKVSDGEIDKALEGDTPKATLVECILQVEAQRAGVPVTPSSGRKRKSLKGAAKATMASQRLGSPPRGNGRGGTQQRRQQRLGSPARFGSSSPTGRAGLGLSSPPRQLSVKEAATAAAAARRLSSPTRSSDRRNMETMNHHTVRRLNSPDRSGRLTSPTRANRVASPEPVRAAAQREAQRRDAATARRVAARKLASPPSRRPGLMSPERGRGVRSGRPHNSPGLEPWSDADEAHASRDSSASPGSSASAVAKWQKAGRKTAQAAVAVKRMVPGCISASEASELVAGIGTEHDDDSAEELVKGARALVMTARANRANVELLVSMGAVEPIVDMLSSRDVDAQECACLALVALSESDDGCTAAAEMGALPRLLSMSSGAAGADKRIVHAATATLAALARLTANGEELAELRVTELLSALCSALEGGTQAQSRVTADTALKLVRLCREGLGYEERGSQGSSVRRAVGELGGISLLVSLLGAGAAPVQLAALDGLKELCKLESNRMKILETDGVELLVSLCEAGSSSAVQRRAKSTLDVFCESSVCRQKVGELRVRSMVLELRLPGHSETLGPTLRALSALCRESQVNRLSAIKANALLDVVRLLTSPSVSLQRAAVDLLKELAREDGAADTAGELGAVEPLMSLLSAATARNDSGLQRATSKCLQLLQRAAPNRERLGKKTRLFLRQFILKMPPFYQGRLGTNIGKDHSKMRCACFLIARLRVSTLVGKLRLAEEQGLSQHPDDGLMDAETLCDHAKSITQQCKDDHSNVARFGELGALPRLVGLLGKGHGPTVDRALTSALRELGWDEVRKRISFAPFYAPNDNFTKAGSGQT